MIKGEFQRPPLFKFYFFFFLIPAIAIPIEIVYLYGHRFEEWPMIVQKLTFLNIGVMLISLCNAVLSLMVSPYLVYSLVFSLATVILNNVWVLQASSDFSPWQIYLSTFAYLACCLIFLVHPQFELINDEKRKWWKMARRYPLTFPVWIENNGQQIYLGKSFDLSRSGAFITYDSQILKNDLGTLLENGKQLELIFGLRSGMQCRAKIVRKSTPQGHYPSGIGIRFTDMTFKSKVRLNQTLLKEIISPVFLH